ncbi:MAG: hypothetical protein OEN02_17800, partial [Gammaproteobacteria bacterium]|nr:hypothetical protein [Gammaproteobacteria bacterium]
MEFNNIGAALYVVIAMSMITTNDAIVKHIAQVFNVGQFMFLRGALIYGYVIWGDRPTLTMLALAIVIVVSGIILLSTEK